MTKAVRSASLFITILLGFSLALSAQGWTASISEKPERLDFEVRIVVVYSDGNSKLQREYRFDGSDINGQLQAQVKAQLAKLTAIDAAVVALKVGVITIAPDPIQTQDQIDQQNFLVLLKDWQAKKGELDAATKSGVMTKLTQQDVDNALSAWKAVYKDMYAQFIVGLF